uniref:Uncharacterized protein n=1 Tax=Clastoptera arizonana TaxID=38151 RepID=A0A1B6D6Z6_9HEMI
MTVIEPQDDEPRPNNNDHIVKSKLDESLVRELCSSKPYDVENDNLPGSSKSKSINNQTGPIHKKDPLPDKNLKRKGSKSKTDKEKGADEKKLYKRIVEECARAWKKKETHTGHTVQ